MQLKHIFTLLAFALSFLSSKAEFKIVFDYSQDKSGFFTQHPEAKVTLEAAGGYVAGFLKETKFAAINVTGGVRDGYSYGNGGSIAFAPMGVVIASGDLPQVPADTVIIYPLSGDLGSVNGSLGRQAVGEMGIVNTYGADGWSDEVLYRGRVGISQASGKCIQPWGGFLLFNSGSANTSTGSGAGPVDWYFDQDASSVEPMLGRADFFSVAVREIAHILGVGKLGGSGAKYAWKVYSPATIDNGGFETYLFTGPASVSVNGGAVNILYPNSIGPNVNSRVAGTSIVQEVAIRNPNAVIIDNLPPNLGRFYLTDLDLAALWDIGYEVSYPGMPKPPVLSQTISFTQGNITSTGVVTLNASATSGRPVTYTLVSGNGSISGNQLQIRESGVFVVKAEQSGDSHYAAALAVTQTFTVRFTPTIEVTSSVFDYTGSPFSASVSVSPAGTPITVRYNGSDELPVNAGIYSVSAIYADALTTISASGTLTISKPNTVATVSIDGTEQVFDGASKLVTVLTTPGGLLTKVTYNGSETPPTAAGAYVVVATVQDAIFTGESEATLFVYDAPKITLQPKSITSPLGSKVVLSVDTAGYPAPSLQWFKNGVLMPNQTGKTLTLVGLTSGDGANYTVASSNVFIGAVHEDLSQVAKLTVGVPSPGGFTGSGPVTTGMIFTGSVSIGSPIDGVTYYAASLPTGLVMNPNTGAISGTVRSNPGTYTFTYWMKVGSAVSEKRTGTIVVGTYPAAFVGSFDGVVYDSNSIPCGKLEVLIASKTGSFTGVFLTENKTSSLSGLTSISASGQEASGKATVDGYSIDFSATVNGGFKVRVIKSSVDFGSTDDGAKRAKGGVTGRYTLLIEDPTNLSIRSNITPTGTGYATATASSTGTLAITGVLGDGTKVTANLYLGIDDAYRVFIRPYSGGGFMAGTLQLSARIDSAQLRHITADGGSDLFWVKTAKATDALYPSGFGPIGLTLRMEPWSAVSLANLRNKLGIDSTGDIHVSWAAQGMSVGDIGGMKTLPTYLIMSSSGVISVVGSNSATFTTKLNLSSGTFTGSFISTASGTAKTVSFAGALLQTSPDDTSVVFAGGRFLLPVPSKGNLTGSISFSVE